jgi:hypothetical protein
MRKTNGNKVSESEWWTGQEQQLNTPKIGFLKGTPLLSRIPIQNAKMHGTSAMATGGGREWIS